MTDGQHLHIAMVSVSVLLVILQFLKRRLLRNEPPGELYEDTARTSVASSVGPLLIVQEEGNRRFSIANATRRESPHE
jgi:hypothetical protein